jgi:hypothetical protein
MIKRRILLIIAGTCLLTAPLLAQNRTGFPAGRGVSHGTGIGRPAPGHGAPRGPVWGDFHHDTSSARISPHRFGSTNLPKPNNWHGDIHNFDLSRWRSGAWQHVTHDGRLAWWWVVGPDWYFFDSPVYPYPDLYTPLNKPFGWWYWCDSYQEYYPYVTYCPLPWESVMPRE